MLTVARWILQVAIGVVIVVELVLGLGVLLQALAANPDASFTEWAYRNQDRLMTPFEDMFDDASIGDSDAVVDVSGLFAMAAYGALFAPLGLAFGRVRRTHALRLQRREDDKMERVRAARFQGRDPAEPEHEAPQGWLERLRSRVARTRPSGDAAGEDRDAKTEWKA